MLYIADWIVNGKTYYTANEDLYDLIANVYKHRIATGKTRYQDIVDLKNKKIACVFKGTMGSKKKGAKITTGVLFYKINSVYTLNSDGKLGTKLLTIYYVGSGEYTSLKDAQRRAMSKLSRTNASVEGIYAIMKNNCIGIVRKKDNAYYWQPADDSGWYPLTFEKKKVRKPAPFGL